ncbi:hypothetical protein HY522_10630 [bacterium]|nr:hypothetical protein [bacterium]
MNLVKLTAWAGLVCIGLMAAPAASAEMTDNWKYSFSFGLKDNFSKPTFFPGATFGDWKQTAVLKADQGQMAAESPGFRYSAGLPYISMTLFEWAKYNRNNEMIGFRGINWGLGFQSKNYFKPMRKHAWNPYWQWGTVLLLLPYVGVGTEFSTGNIFFEIATFYIIPYPALGIHF